MGLRRVRNPVKLAGEMLVRGDGDLEGGNGERRERSMTMPTPASVIGYGDKDMDELYANSRGAQGHCQLQGAAAEKLAKEWGLELVDPSYFFVQSRWDDHIAGLEREKNNMGLATWDKQAFVPQGTCGAVALDSDGVCACATSTGGMTNKLTGRIGDTPTLGAGFWAEKWDELYANNSMGGSPILELSDSLRGLVADCLPSLGLYVPISKDQSRIWRATAMSGTGNGDSFLRTNAVRTASAIARYQPNTSLKTAMKQITGPGGELQKSAGDRWKKTGEGEGGIIGIQVIVEEDGEGVVRVKSEIVEEFNCGGMWRALIDDEGKAVCRVWRDGEIHGIEEYEGEAISYDVGRWRSEKNGGIGF